MKYEVVCPYCGQKHIIEPPYREKISNITYITNIPNLIMAQAIKEAKKATQGRMGNEAI